MDVLIAALFMLLVLWLYVRAGRARRLWTTRKNINKKRRKTP